MYIFAVSEVILQWFTPILDTIQLQWWFVAVISSNGGYEKCVLEVDIGTNHRYLIKQIVHVAKVNQKTAAKM